MNIALDDIRKQAPEGATHYTVEPDFSVVSYWKIVGRKIASWSKDDAGWITYYDYEGYTSYIISIAKPL